MALTYTHTHVQCLNCQKVQLTQGPFTHSEVRNNARTRVSACKVVVVFGRPFVKRFALCYRTVVLSVCPVCNVGVLWPNGWMDQDETWHEGRPPPRPHCVRWGPNSSPKRAQPPIFGPCHLWPNGWMD